MTTNSNADNPSTNSSTTSKNFQNPTKVSQVVERFQKHRASRETASESLTEDVRLGLCAEVESARERLTAVNRRVL